ncbi:hypothetical protein JKP13_19555 [Vibrio vulnificus]|uniref:hypothetical protein n=1 Tax=Vibrio vulnificus TaxID=672 RepID=UPI001CDD5323|nr:hypothetical protein [Vibrio vulnificus]MCA3879426.1 hypothetical protein [Vibrio vulnificus]MCA3949264.1 hypothetical protein [Vibrio vulnificus]
MDSRAHGNDDGWRGGGVLSFYGIVALLVFFVIICSSNFFLITSVCQPLSVSQFVILGRWGSIVQRVLLLGITALLPVLLSVSLYVVVGCGKCVSKRDIWRVWMNGFPCARE